MGALRGIPPLEGVGRNEVRPQGETSPSLYFKRSFSVTLIVYTLRILLEGQILRMSSGGCKSWRRL